jgi:hypothetical protein
LKPHFTHRHTACIRYTSPPHRSHATFSTSHCDAGWVDRIGWGRRAAIGSKGAGFSEADITVDYRVA